MGKGRGREPPGRPDALWSELEDAERQALECFADSLSVPVEAWPHLEEMADLVVSVACARRIERLRRVEGISKSAAFRRTATGFGMTVASVKAAHYRREERALRARQEAREQERDGATV